MLKKLYNSGYFNYEKFIIENLKKLSLSPDEAIVLTKLLYYAKKEQKESTKGLFIMHNISILSFKIDVDLLFLLKTYF